MSSSLLRSPERLSVAAVEDEVAIVLHDESRIVVSAVSLGWPNRVFLLISVCRCELEHEIAIWLKSQISLALNVHIGVSRPESMVVWRSIDYEVVVLLHDSVVLWVSACQSLTPLKSFVHPKRPVDLDFVKGLLPNSAHILAWHGSLRMIYRSLQRIAWLDCIWLPKDIILEFAAVYNQITVILHDQSRIIILSVSVRSPYRPLVLAGIERVIENKVAVTLHNQVQVSHFTVCVWRPNGFSTWRVNHKIAISLNYGVERSVLACNFFLFFENLANQELVVLWLNNC